VIVLGIDPGTAALGYGIVERAAGRLRAIDYGVVATPSTDSLPTRLRTLHASLHELIELHAPDLIGVERLFFSRNAQTAFAIGQARGVVLLAAAQHDLPVREATPSEVKSAVAGHGRAAKAEVARMAQLILAMPEIPAPDDAADALAVAITIANVETSLERRSSGPLDLAALPGRKSDGGSSYDRAVREALAAERGTRPTAAARSAARRRSTSVRG
jgi:crossover junction endodeoxyribonuclease RuvC